MKIILLLITQWLLPAALFAQDSTGRSAFCRTCKVDLSPLSLVKYWSVYQIKPASLSTHDDAISSLEITGSIGLNSYSGLISFGNWNNTPQSDSCKLSFYEHDLQINAGLHNWAGKIYKATGDSMIFGLTGQFMYYLVKVSKLKTLPSVRETITVNLQTESVKHNWTVFKVESEPGFIKSGYWILRGLNITTNTGLFQYKGTVTFDNQGSRKTGNCTISLTPGSGSFSTKAFIVTEGQSWFMELSKLDGKEMTLGNLQTDGVRYNLKTD